jgi:hypothetical protein
MKVKIPIQIHQQLLAPYGEDTLNKSCVVEVKGQEKSREIWTGKTSSGLEGLSPQHTI